ncbi:MAG: response regulator [Pseudomonadota bacterium]
MGKESGLNGMDVLVVDDEPDVLDTVEEMLETCTVHKANDFRTALHCLETGTFDIVILDIMGVNGFELLRHAVARGFTTVMLTAHAVTTEALKRSITLGAASFLPKEYMGDLKELLEDILRGEGKRFWWHKSVDLAGAGFAGNLGAEGKQKNEVFRKFEEQLKKSTAKNSPGS